MINRKKLPTSLNRYAPADYYDVFEDEFYTPVPPQPIEFLHAVFSTYPKWVEYIFRLRNQLVRPFGLKEGRFEPEKLNEMIRIQNDKEVIGELNDKHLLFVIHLPVTPLGENRYRVQIGTVVHFHNFMGRIYFRIIAPFHRLIVPAMLKRTLRNIEEEYKKSAPATS